MEIKVQTYFDEDRKEDTFADMIQKLVNELAEATGIDLSKIEQNEALRILRELIKDFYALVMDTEEEGDLGSWLELVLEEIASR